MSSDAQRTHLTEYFLNNKVLVTGFNSYDEAENYANNTKGELTEVVFRGGNDNPELSSKADLIENKMPYLADAGPEFVYLHSSNPEFQKIADEFVQNKDEIIENTDPEKRLIQGVAKIEEDPVIVLKNGSFDSITTKEQSKYGKGIKVYQIGVLRD